MPVLPQFFKPLSEQPIKQTVRCFLCFSIEFAKNDRKGHSLFYICRMSLLSVHDFISNVNDNNHLLIDARSEGEFEHAHFPGAINIPLLNNEHRILVGTCFKKEGRDAAVRLGFELVGPLFSSFVKKVDELGKGKEILVYCWRGGMRSGIISWVLNMVGYRTHTLKGGYKAFRRFVLDQFIVERKFRVVGGHTGSGKTDLLMLMKEAGHQVIDLEGLANHRGSAFGSLGMKPQPRNEYFENELALQLYHMKGDEVIWLEAESRSIGRIKLPDEFYFQFIAAPLFEVNLSREERVERIKKDYSHFTNEELSECMKKLSKRLGGLGLKEALKALEENRTGDWISILLDYYDKTYSHSLESRTTNTRFEIEMKDKNDFESVMNKVLSLSKNITQ